MDVDHLRWVDCEYYPLPVLVVFLEQVAGLLRFEFLAGDVVENQLPLPEVPAPDEQALRRHLPRLGRAGGAGLCPDFLGDPLGLFGGDAPFAGLVADVIHRREHQGGLPRPRRPDEGEGMGLGLAGFDECPATGTDGG